MPLFLRALASAACLALAAAGPGTATAATAQVIGPAFPQFASAADLKRPCEQGLAEARRGQRLIERQPADGRWIDAYDRFSARLEDLANPVQFMLNVHPDKAIRSAAEACELRWNDFYSSLGQNQRLYQVVKRLQLADEGDKLLRQTLLEAFDDAGVSLPPPTRARAKRLNDRISELGLAFERQVCDANVKLAFTEDELAGVPASVWQSAKRDAQGHVLLGVDFPSHDPVMQSALRASTRERMWRAKTNEGGEANLKLLAEITRLRKDYATPLGAASWSEFVLRRRMAGTPARAMAFLDEVKSAVQQRERDELADLRALKSRHLNQDEAATRHLYASYDLTLYGSELQVPMALWARTEGDTLLGHVPGTMYPAGFAHIATHYSAGYYGYLWSLVVAMDLRTAFAADRLDPVVGRRYRDTVLAQGGQRPPQALVRDFLGRDFNAKAFFDDIKR